MRAAGAPWRRARHPLPRPRSAAPGGRTRRPLHPEPSQERSPSIAPEPRPGRRRGRAECAGESANGHPLKSFDQILRPDHSIRSFDQIIRYQGKTHDRRRSNILPFPRVYPTDLAVEFPSGRARKRQTWMKPALAVLWILTLAAAVAVGWLHGSGRESRELSKVATFEEALAARDELE